MKIGFPVLVLLLAACSIAPSENGTGGAAAAKAASPYFRLTYARAEADRSANSDVYYAKGEIELDNTGYGKVVKVVYREFGGLWKTGFATYLSSIGGNREKWSFRVRIGEASGVWETASTEFALCLSHGGVDTWDNNGGPGVNYRLTWGYNENGIPTGAIGGANILVKSVVFSGALLMERSFQGEILVRNVGFGKAVKVAWTQDAWSNVNTASAGYKGTKDGLESWYFQAPYIDGRPIEYAAVVEKDGRSWWDNNFGKNYSVRLR